VNDFVRENKIEELPIAANTRDTSVDSVLRRGPSVLIPDIDRAIRRQDIPDSWILEAALDLKGPRAQ